MSDMIEEEGFDEIEDDDLPVAWQDTLFNISAILTFIICVLILTMEIRQVHKPIEEKTDKVPGEMMVEMVWPENSCDDLDLWVKGPGDKPIGYSNKGGVLFNLMRDDLGCTNDIVKRNYEVQFSHGLVQGTYVVNVHSYRINNVANLPEDVDVTVSVKKKPDQPAVEYLHRQFKITKEHQEITVFSFKLDADGELVQGSVNSLFVPLRSGAK